MISSASSSSAAGSVSRHTLQHEVAQLRAFLRYAHDAGLVRERLDGLDTPRTYRGELPPRALPWPSVLQAAAIDRPHEPQRTGATSASCI